MDRQCFEKLVVCALKQTIIAHGAIDLKWIGSAAKRISHQIFGEFKAQAKRKPSLLDRELRVPKN